MYSKVQLIPLSYSTIGLTPPEMTCSQSSSPLKELNPGFLDSEHFEILLLQNKITYSTFSRILEIIHNQFQKDPGNIISS